jgi:V8-like Glu-specific endopeptidase
MADDDLEELYLALKARGHIVDVDEPPPGFGPPPPPRLRRRAGPLAPLLGESDRALMERFRDRVRAVYGADSRTMWHDVTNAEVRKDGEGVALLIDDRTDLLSTTSTTHKTLIEGTFLGPTAVAQMCEGEKWYRHRRSFGFCSAFLVGPDLMITAGHCVPPNSPKPLANIGVVFDYQTVSANLTLGDNGRQAEGFQPQTLIPNANYYTIKEVLTQFLSPSTDPDPRDYAVIRLDRPVTGNRTIRPIRRSGVAEADTAMHLIGHGWGFAKHYSDGPLRENKTNYWTNTIDAHPGHSGAPVFNSETHVVEGIYVRGFAGSFFQEDPPSGCITWFSIPDDTPDRLGHAQSMAPVAAVVPRLPGEGSDVVIPDTVVGTGPHALRFVLAQAVPTAGASVRFDAYVEQTKLNAGGPLVLDARASQADAITHAFELRGTFTAGAHTAWVVRLGTTDGGPGTLWIRGATFGGDALDGQFPIGLANDEESAPFAFEVEGQLPPVPPPPPGVVRTLWIDAVSIDGVGVAGPPVKLTGLGATSLAFHVGAGSPPPPPPPPPGTTVIGTGPNALLLTVSQDYYQGDAQFNVLVDGVVVAGPLTVTVRRT